MIAEVRLRHPVTVTMDEGLLWWAKAAAAADGRSLSRFVERAVEAYRARGDGRGDFFPTSVPEVRPGRDAVSNGGCDE